MDDLDAQQPLGEHARNKPEVSLKEWQLYQPVVRFEQGMPNTEIGVKASDGTYIPYLHGESTVLVRHGDDRRAMVRLSDGSEVGFDQWRATRREGVQAALDRIGGDYAYMYMEMLGNHPHLEQLDIETSTPDEHSVLRYTAGFWQRPSSERPHPRIVVNAEPGNTNLESLLVTREISARRAADLIGISFEELKQRPALLGLFIFFHEVGHADDYIRNYHMKPDAQDPSGENYRVRAAEMNSLPVPSSNPVVVREMYESGELEEYFAKYRDYYNSLGITSAVDLMQKHEAAYHDLPTEVYADVFAAKVLKSNAERLGIELDNETD